MGDTCWYFSDNIAIHYRYIYSNNYNSKWVTFCHSFNTAYIHLYEMEEGTLFLIKILQTGAFVY